MSVAHGPGQEQGQQHRRCRSMPDSEVRVNRMENGAPTHNDNSSNPAAQAGLGSPSPVAAILKGQYHDEVEQEYV